MKRYVALAVLCAAGIQPHTSLVAAELSAATGSGADADQYWPQWRGPLATGVGPRAHPPVFWSETKNVRWKVAVPAGSSSPVVWGDLVFLTAAAPTDKPAPPPPPGGHPAVSGPRSAFAFQVLAYDRKDGAERWKTTVREELPHEGTHQDGTYAGGSVVTDGERIYAFFGSRGLYCLDMAGQKLWEKDLGRMSIKMGFGEGASPALHGDRLVVNWDHEGASFLVALDSKTGRELWRAPRDEKTTWATPLVVAVAGGAHVVTSASSRVRGYDLATGRLLWDGPGLTANAIPTPVSGDGIVYLTSGFRGSALLAVKLSAARGDVTGTPAVLWRYDQDTPYVPSPLLYAGGLYFLKSNSAILTRLDAGTGEKHFSARLEGLDTVYASPVAAADRVYVTDRKGATAVIGAGRDMKVLAVNTLDDGFDASPALADGDIYLRGRRHLYRITETTAR
jgi:outer membrane protein assembly factor BamB